MGICFRGLAQIVSCFHEGVNLISFSLADLLLGPKQLRFPNQEDLNAKHLQLAVALDEFVSLG
jgi:hypothetical protein